MAVRIQKLIADAGICSRRRAEELIENGRVLYNGKKAKIGQTADLSEDEVLVDGEPLKLAKKIYIMLNKPAGVVATVSDKWGNTTVVDLIPIQQRLFPVGRLDKDTTGLLLMTNDGVFANKVMHPRYEIPRTYEVILDRKFESMGSVKDGVELDGKKIRATIKPLGGRNVQITVHTGMHKEVKRIFKQLGYWVRGLKRVQLGDLKLNVQQGKFRHLVPSEVKKFL